MIPIFQITYYPAVFWTLIALQYIHPFHESCCNKLHEKSLSQCHRHNLKTLFLKSYLSTNLTPNLKNSYFCSFCESQTRTIFHSIQSSLVLQVWQTHVTDVKVLKRLSISSVVFSCAQMLIFSAFLDTDGLIKISGAVLFSLRMMHYHRVEIALELALGRVVIFVDKSSFVAMLWRGLLCYDGLKKIINVFRELWILEKIFWVKKS